MTYLKKQARRDAFSIVQETCPQVESLIRNLLLDSPEEAPINEIMAIIEEHGTTPLRYALIDALTEKLELENRVEELEDRIRDLEQLLASKDHEYAALRQELEEAL